MCVLFDQVSTDREAKRRPLGALSRSTRVPFLTPLEMQRLAGNRATAGLLARQAGTAQRSIVHDASIVGAASWYTSHSEGSTVSLEDFVTEIIATRPSLAAQKSAIRELMKPFAGKEPPDFVYGDTAAALDWLAGRLGDLDEEDDSTESAADESEESESTDPYEAALARFVTRNKETDFSNTGQAPRFDQEFWKCTVKVTIGKTSIKPFSFSEQSWQKLEGAISALRAKQKNAEVDYDFSYDLLPGKRPSSAINAIYKHSSRWAFDCIDFIVAARLYAELAVIGADAFDVKYGNIGGADLSPQPMRLAQHETPGLASGSLWERDGPGEPFTAGDEEKDAAPADPASEDAFLGSVPIGCRVMWSTNFEGSGINEDMRNENTIKVGATSYAAHPLGVCTPAEIRQEMVADGVDPADVATHIATFIYVREVEFYPKPEV